jgi:hypothetical protein
LLEAEPGIGAAVELAEIGGAAAGALRRAGWLAT